MTELLKQKGNNITRYGNAEESFKKLKRKKNSKLKLSIPSEKGQFILYTDASDIGISIVLNQ